MEKKSREQPEKPDGTRKDGEEGPRTARKPRGALFHGDDPTLAKRAEEELYSSGRR